MDFSAAPAPTLTATIRLKLIVRQQARHFNFIDTSFSFTVYGYESLPMRI
jgi:hypothetical protein